MANLQLKNVNKIYDNKVQAVFDFNLDIEDKEFIVFVGPSGCGKTDSYEEYSFPVAAEELSKYEVWG